MENQKTLLKLADDLYNAIVEHHSDRALHIIEKIRLVIAEK